MKHEIINDINLTLRSLLETELKTVFKNVSVKMADLENFKKGETKTGVNIFLYSIIVNEPGFAPLNPQERTGEGPDGEVLFYPSPVFLTLCFMLTPFATDPQTEYRLLGRIIQVFQENPVLTGEALKGDWLPELEKLVFTPDMHLSFERQLEIFRSFDAPLKMSVGYIARTQVLSDKVLRRAKIARHVRPEMARKPVPPENPLDEQRNSGGGYPEPKKSTRVG